jgi:hypothetical protein
MPCLFFPFFIRIVITSAWAYGSNRLLNVFHFQWRTTSVSWTTKTKRSAGRKASDETDVAHCKVLQVWSDKQRFFRRRIAHYGHRIVIIVWIRTRVELGVIFFSVGVWLDAECRWISMLPSSRRRRIWPGSKFHERSSKATLSVKQAPLQVQVVSDAQYTWPIKSSTKYSQAFSPADPGGQPPTGEQFDQYSKFNCIKLAMLVTSSYMYDV